MELACNFLNCTQGSLPFKYLGLPVGANSGRTVTWEPLLEILNQRLNNWENKYISIGGRIVLLNSVLNSIPIFYLSFMKMPSKVWRKIVRIQREFLWGGVSGGRSINWVSWKEVCQPKHKGGLGMRDVRVINLSLLAKWRWRLIQDGAELWRKVLREKYGGSIGDVVESGDRYMPSFTSLWWKDLMKLDAGDNLNWFNSEVSRRVGNGDNTSF